MSYRKHGVRNKPPSAGADRPTVGRPLAESFSKSCHQSSCSLHPSLIRETGNHQRMTREGAREGACDTSEGAETRSRIVKER